MNSICEIVRFNILGWVTTSWTYSTIMIMCNYADRKIDFYLAMGKKI